MSLFDRMRYYLKVCQLMVSDKNPNNIFRCNTCCGCTLICGSYICGFVFLYGLMIGIFAFIGYLYTALGNFPHNIHTGCTLNITDKCVIPLDSCHIGSLEGVGTCIITGVKIFGCLIAIIILIRIIYTCKTEVVKSVESAKELTDVIIIEAVESKNK